jgi:Ca2+-binding RTX toxin-like protein
MRKAAWALCGVAIFLTGALLEAGTGTTYAQYSDSVDITGNTASAGVWATDSPTPSPSNPPIPAECGDPSNYDSVMYGTPGNDVLNGDNHNQIIMGLGGDDVIHGGNGDDCIVGGDGNDQLYGDNGKDILIGGDGDDILVGDNADDLLDGGAGTDLCDGGHAPDTSIGCEPQP